MCQINPRHFFVPFVAFYEKWKTLQDLISWQNMFDLVYVKVSRQQEFYNCSFPIFIYINSSFSLVTLTEQQSWNIFWNDLFKRDMFESIQERGMVYTYVWDLKYLAVKKVRTMFILTSHLLVHLPSKHLLVQIQQ